jgi:hypothetical protein
LENPAHIATSPDLAAWPLVILVDDAKATCSSPCEFLWSVFTRFDPASDIYCAATTQMRHRIHYKGPLLIDARMKPSYPAEAQAAEETVELVNTKWGEYQL